MRKIITDQLLAKAADIAIPRAERQAIYTANDIENAAMRTHCKDGRTIKEIVDHLVIDLGCKNWVRRGGWLYVSNSDESSRYQLRVDYAPYLRVVIQFGL